MLKNKTMDNFNKRINEYDIYTTEKEIETEFYKFISKYYENKYTVFGEGKISYTAPYNIDGLLEVKTLDADYRILVEAKAGKDFGNKIIRNEVLSQAIYYCRKLKSYGEQLPSILILLEAKSMVVINVEDLKDFIEDPNINSSASTAYKTDYKLINKLNKTNYEYKLIELNGKTDYNNIFTNIDYIGLSSIYSKFKMDDSQDTYLKINDFINKYKIFKNEKSYYYYINNNYIKTAMGSIKSLLLQEVNLRAITINKGFKIFEELISEI